MPASLRDTARVRQSAKKEKPIRVRFRGESEVATHASLLWEELAPAERLRRSWKLRERLPDPERVHDEKLFPRP